MAIIREVRGYKPQIGEKCFIAENAVLCGDLVMGDNCSVWFHTTIRADVNSVRIGDNVNIQDGTVVHCTYEKSQTIIGDNVSIGHNAIIHGCIIHDNVLIGMGSVIMDNAEIPSGTVIGAGALVPEGKKLESGFIYVGSPARKLRKMSDETYDFSIRRTAENYIKYSSWYK